MTAGLSTHVLDTARGCPAAGVRLRLSRVEGDTRTLLRETVTNSDGRTDAPLIERGALERGTYELAFDVAEYFSGFEAAAQPPFLDVVTLRFTVGDTGGALSRSAAGVAVVLQHVSGELGSGKSGVGKAPSSCSYQDALAFPNGPLPTPAPPVIHPARIASPNAAPSPLTPAQPKRTYAKLESADPSTPPRK